MNFLRRVVGGTLAVTGLGIMIAGASLVFLAGLVVDAKPRRSAIEELPDADEGEDPYQGIVQRVLDSEAPTLH